MHNLYKVIEDFMDLKDFNHIYREGDLYPRDGMEPPVSRIEQLLGSDNRFGRPLIEEIPEVKKAPAKKIPPKKTAVKPKTAKK